MKKFLKLIIILGVSSIMSLNLLGCVNNQPNTEAQQLKVAPLPPGMGH